MATLTKAVLQDVLARGAGLKSPRFRLRNADDKIVGSVISDTFKGMTNRERQRMMWDALHAALDEATARRVGMLLPYTDDEWDEPLEGMATRSATRPRASKKAS